MSVLPVFPTKSVIVTELIFRSLVQFEFIFVYGVRKYSNFVLLHVAVQFSEHCLLKRLYFLHSIFLPPLSKTRSLTSGSGKTGQPLVKDETRTLSNTIHKNKLKLD